MASASHRGHPDHDACGTGFVAQLGGRGTHAVLQHALTALERLNHRGGVDADGCSGDGAGVLTALPSALFPAFAGDPTVAVGMLFLPRKAEQEACRAVEDAISVAGLKLLGWRDVPTRPEVLGRSALATAPIIRQVFVGGSGDDFDRVLLIARKTIELFAPAGTYVCSLSQRTIVYKGLLTPRQLRDFYQDLCDPAYATPFAIFHQRYSTNTQPTWSLAQPFRYIAHNGEINTIVANRRWLRAREHEIWARLAPGHKLRALEPNVSDSASFDNAFELMLAEQSDPELAMLRMVPPVLHESTQELARANRVLTALVGQQEPWDGPAALVFSDGVTVGAKLDRNGLRPLRYWRTRQGLVVVGSEVGIVDVASDDIVERQRLGPGEMLACDPLHGVVRRWPAYLRHLAEQQPTCAPARLELRAPCNDQPTLKDAIQIAAALGWSEDQLRLLLEPAARSGKEAIWSMGDDGAPAFLSSLGRPLWDFCKQRFAQVTNPPVDPLREARSMSLDTRVGDVILASPILDSVTLAQLEAEWRSRFRTIDMTFPASERNDGALESITHIRNEARAAAERGCSAIVLSDRSVSATRAALPALIATSAAWQAVVDRGGHDIALIVQTGQVVDSHHVAMLLATGAAAVVPYVALHFAAMADKDGVAHYCAAVNAALLKILARMGISTLASYRNSQLFETVGLDPHVCTEFFEDAAHVYGGRTLNDVLHDALARHASAFCQERPLKDSGLFRFRKDGERHGSSPEVVRRMHAYIKTPTVETYRAYEQLGSEREPVAVRDLLEVVGEPKIALEEVESEQSILARFSTQAMSLGALSPEAHRTLAIAMNRLGARSNTGEGGEDPELRKTMPEAANRIKQVASGRFGVTLEYLAHADELEIKMAQGSKPGEGGQLPAGKVTPFIARLRHAVPGMSLISPPPHHDIYSIEDLAQLIHDLRAVNPHARIGVKLVSGAGVGIIAAGVAKAGADVITISGHDGGTGASPLSSIKNTGLPWEVGLQDAHRALLHTGMRNWVRLRVDGGLKFSRDVLIAALLGADEFGFGTAALLAIGCVMARQCHLNTCPVGIATQDEKLRTRFAGDPEMVIAFFRGLAQDLRQRLADIGARSLDQIVGRSHYLRARDDNAATHVGELFRSLPRIATDQVPKELPRRESPSELQFNAGIAMGLHSCWPITNADRSVGAQLSGRLARRRARRSVKITREFRGVAGQSFGAFLAHPVTFRLLGEANDYVGKGLSGGTVVITSGSEASARGDVLVGNTVLYGATSGELYVAGRAGERFAVRNSGANAVIEGVGQHGCEYMTGGVVLVLGPVGQNFGAGMTGGLAYVVREAIAPHLLNREFVLATPVEEVEQSLLRRVLTMHAVHTRSSRAQHLLSLATLPLARVQPVNLPCSIEQTWAPWVARMDQRGPATFADLRTPEFVAVPDPIHPGEEQASI